MNSEYLVEYETDNYILLCDSDIKYILLDLKSGSFKILNIIYDTTMWDLLDFVKENTDNEFLEEYIDYCKENDYFPDDELVNIDLTADEIALKKYKSGEYSYQDYVDVCDQEETMPLSKEEIKKENKK